MTQSSPEAPPERPYLFLTRHHDAADTEPPLCLREFVEALVSIHDSREIADARLYAIVEVLADAERAGVPAVALDWILYRLIVVVLEIEAYHPRHVMGRNWGPKGFTVRRAMKSIRAAVETLEAAIRKLTREDEREHLLGELDYVQDRLMSAQGGESTKYETLALLADDQIRAVLNDHLMSRNRLTHPLTLWLFLRSVHAFWTHLKLSSDAGDELAANLLHLAGTKPLRNDRWTAATTKDHRRRHAQVGQTLGA